MRTAILITLLATVFAVGTVAAADPTGPVDIEARAAKIEGLLMAPCCMANPVSQHFSGSADAMRVEIRTMLAEGKSQEQILQHYVDEHGDLILAMPRASGFNLTAYLLPFFFLVIGSVAMIFVIRSWTSRTVAHAEPAPVPAGPIDDEYADRLQARLREMD